jgi:N-acetylneuraminate synthase/N,N'-diacetyllegionaminate synthase
MTQFAPTFQIADRQVGGDAPCLIIAEAGVAHFGDMDLAEQLVTLAAEGGADVFKTQFFDVEALIARRAPDWQDRLRPRNLTFEEARQLKDMCDRLGLLFMSTAHDETRIKWLLDLDVPAVKVGSGECNNPAFLTKLAEIGRPMIVSTGMYTQDDVHEAVDACAAGGCTDLALLHCVTSYPAPAEDINLSAMDTMAGFFAGPVGYSDHTDGELAVLAAVARGAKIVEKHVTILRDVPNAQDWKVSAGRENFAELVTRIRTTEALIGHGRKEPAASEQAGMAWAKKSLVATRNLPAGTVLREADLVAKRPGDGVIASRIGDLTGRTLRVAVEADDPLLFENVE